MTERKDKIINSQAYTSRHQFALFCDSQNRKKKRKTKTKTKTHRKRDGEAKRVYSEKLLETILSLDVCDLSEIYKVQNQHTIHRSK